MYMSEIKEKKVEIKNYIILSILFIATIGLTLYLCKLYKVYDEYKKQTPIIRDTLFEITSEDVEHFILENPSSILYMCTSSSDNCRTYEKKFKKLIKAKGLQNSIIYLNLSDADQNKFIKEFNSKYKFRIKLTEAYPAIAVFEDGEIVNLLQGKENEPLTVVKTKQFMEIHKIGE